jgi:hypothetical protein
MSDDTAKEDADLLRDEAAARIARAETAEARAAKQRQHLESPSAAGPETAAARTIRQEAIARDEADAVRHRRFAAALTRAAVALNPKS